MQSGAPEAGPVCCLLGLGLVVPLLVPTSLGASAQFSVPRQRLAQARIQGHEVRVAAAFGEPWCDKRGTARRAAVWGDRASGRCRAVVGCKRATLGQQLSAIIAETCTTMYNHIIKG